ncbi:hypothetical protein BC829DRAFT_491644 [Chytridium lagenaria]|nr:hypothetical protein BC829DRAFT_491644 [Chytridium lagenaria]
MNDDDHLYKGRQNNNGTIIIHINALPESLLLSIFSILTCFPSPSCITASQPPPCERLVYQQLAARTPTPGPAFIKSPYSTRPRPQPKRTVPYEIHLSSVCKTWRNVALQLPHSASLNIPSFLTLPKLIQMGMSNSGLDRGLKVFACRDRIEKLKGLEIYIPGTSASTLCQLFPTPLSTPRLESISLNIRLKEWDHRTDLRHEDYYEETGGEDFYDANVVHGVMDVLTRLLRGVQGLRIYVLGRTLPRMDGTMHCVHGRMGVKPDGRFAMDGSGIAEGLKEGGLKALSIRVNGPRAWTGWPERVVCRSFGGTSGGGTGGGGGGKEDGIKDEGLTMEHDHVIVDEAMEMEMERDDDMIKVTNVTPFQQWMQRIDGQFLDGDRMGTPGNPPRVWSYTKPGTITPFHATNTTLDIHHIDPSIHPSILHPVVPLIAASPALTVLRIECGHTDLSLVAALCPRLKELEEVSMGVGTWRGGRFAGYGGEGRGMLGAAESWVQSLAVAACGRGPFLEVFGWRVEGVVARNAFEALSVEGGGGGGGGCRGWGGWEENEEEEEEVEVEVELGAEEPWAPNEVQRQTVVSIEGVAFSGGHAVEVGLETLTDFQTSNASEEDVGMDVGMTGSGIEEGVEEMVDTALLTLSTSSQRADAPLYPNTSPPHTPNHLTPAPTSTSPSRTTPRPHPTTPSPLPPTPNLPHAKNTSGRAPRPPHAPAPPPPPPPSPRADRSRPLVHAPTAVHDDHGEFCDGPSDVVCAGWKCFGEGGGGGRRMWVTLWMRKEEVEGIEGGWIQSVEEFVEDGPVVIKFKVDDS